MQEFVKVPWENMILSKDIIEGIIVEPDDKCEEPRYRIQIWLKKDNTIGRAICSLWTSKKRAEKYYYNLLDALIKDGD